MQTFAVPQQYNYTIPTKYSPKHFNYDAEVGDNIALLINTNQCICKLYIYNDYYQEGSILTTIQELYKHNSYKITLSYLKAQDIDYKHKDRKGILIIDEAFNDSFKDFLSVEKRRCLEYIISYRISNMLPIIVMGYVSNKETKVKVTTTQLSTRILNMLEMGGI